MPPKAKTPPPIDRPLSKAYLRGFKGWSTAYPPGQSDPASCRIIDNMQVDRNGALRVRYGLRYLSYLVSPDLDPSKATSPGTPLGTEPVGETELFYTADGSRALLFAVREGDGSVGFRALLFSGKGGAVFPLDHPSIGFLIPQGTAALNFSSRTKYVRYLQINNRILALSDAGESARMFLVGAQKIAKRLTRISVPEWLDSQKLTVFQPDAAWINAKTASFRSNLVPNPVFRAGTDFWRKGPNTDWTPTFINNLTEWKARVIPLSGANPAQILEIRSLPERTNIASSPLNNVAATGLEGWFPHDAWVPMLIIDDGSWMQIDGAPGKQFYARSAKLTEGIVSGGNYRVGVDMEKVGNVQAQVMITFYSVDGAQIDAPLVINVKPAGARIQTPAFKAPQGSVTARVSFGGINNGTSIASVKVKNVVFCRDNEPLDAFDGGSGPNYFWTGLPNLSASVYHPPQDVSIIGDRMPIVPSQPLYSRIEVALAGTAARNVTLSVPTYTKDGVINATPGATTVSVPNTGASWTTIEIKQPAAQISALQVSAILTLTVAQLARGERVAVTRVSVTPRETATVPYFDGTTKDTSTVLYYWDQELKPHRSPSTKRTLTAALPVPAPEGPSGDTLIAGTTAENVAKNKFKMGFFFTFENEVGESAPSKITEVRMQRAWSDWLWQVPDANGKPAGATTEPALCADQLFVRMPQEVYDQAVSEGALKWNLYAMSWSDQDPVPVEGQLVGTRQMRAPGQLATEEILSWADGGWISVTPERTITLSSLPLPTAAQRENYSIPPTHRSGMVAGERMILVGSPTDLASIQWSSNRPAESTNFTSAKGGGIKTLTSGNLNTPSDVVLWQNPQSADTVTILCTGDDGAATAYYMSPAEVVQGQSGLAGVMGFEEVTSTPGTTGPYGALVTNNALMRPTDLSYLKSSASNYNINHKAMSDDISNMWRGLREKQWIVAAQLDNRIFLLVYNADGDLIEDGHRGNEIWVLDVGTEGGTWSRYTIQAHSLSVFTVGTRPHMGVIRNDGIYYFDYRQWTDDVVAAGKVVEQPIPWEMETNTQGANRAHDAWCHLQQVVVMLGNFIGKLEYGVRGVTLEGQHIEMVKRVEDQDVSGLTPTWDLEDWLLIKRNLKEWYFFARSVPGEVGVGQIGAVQYRYTPSTVNSYYEFGSPETFEYGANVAQGPNSYSTNGVPVPFQDFTRP